MYLSPSKYQIVNEGRAIEVKTENTVTPEQTADYIHGIVRELRTLAANSNMGFLAYLLAMAEDESGETARRLKASGKRAGETQPS